MKASKYLNILGIRGFPAAHGGFETFAANFSPFMRDNGWKVTVYCQEDEGISRPKSWTDEYEGIRRIHFETRTRGALATMEFDLRCVINVLRQPGVDLVLGYNTAIFNIIQVVFGRRVLINMDGIEWKREKWGRIAKLWFWINEWFGSRFLSAVIADHPEIAAHLATRGCKKAVVIPYGSDSITSASIEHLSSYGLAAYDYFISIARIEPENSILEIVQAFVRANTGRKLIVLGKLEDPQNAYHAQVRKAADDNVIFPSAIYDRAIVSALRYYCIAYMHGHQVGGTNPSLVEALGAGNPVIAHSNRFNHWTAGKDQMYFSSVEECVELIRKASMHADSNKRERAYSASVHRERFTFDVIHNAYLSVIEQQLENILEDKTTK